MLALAHTHAHTHTHSFGSNRRRPGRTQTCGIASNTCANSAENGHELEKKLTTTRDPFDLRSSSMRNSTEALTTQGLSTAAASACPSATITMPVNNNHREGSAHWPAHLPPPRPARAHRRQKGRRTTSHSLRPCRPASARAPARTSPCTRRPAAGRQLPQRWRPGVVLTSLGPHLLAPEVRRTSKWGRAHAEGRQGALSRLFYF